jgi:RNA-directed DNA polymerase
MSKQLSIFDKPPIKNKEQILLDLFNAYYSARKNKRNTINQLQFEINYEKQLIELYQQIISYSYKPKRSICFVVNKPVKREIFAADFSDRVVHHLIYNYIMPIFNTTFLNDSYSCRIGKGAHYGIGSTLAPYKFGVIF